MKKKIWLTFAVFLFVFCGTLSLQVEAQRRGDPGDSNVADRLGPPPQHPQYRDRANQVRSVSCLQQCGDRSDDCFKAALNIPDAYAKRDAAERCLAESNACKARCGP